MYEPSKKPIAVRDVRFDGTHLQTVLAQLSIDCVQLSTKAGITISAKTLKNWIKNGCANRKMFAKFMTAVNSIARSTHRDGLILPTSFISSAPEEGRAIESTLEAEPDRPEIAQAMRCLYQAKSTRDGSIAVELLTEVVRLCEYAFEETGDEFAMVVASHALVRLAAESMARGKRAEYYQRAIDVVFSLSSADALEQRAQAVKCAAGDPLSGVATAKLARWITDAREAIAQALRNRPDDFSPLNQSDLLARSSALLRASIGLLNPREADRTRWLAEASRCVTRAISSLDTQHARLEEALVEWWKVHLPHSEAQYASSLRRVAAMLNIVNENGFDESALLALVQLHRQNFTPLLACRLFDQWQKGADDWRLVLEHAFIYAESAVILSYWVLPENEIKRHLHNAERLINDAIHSGFKTARHLSAQIRLLGRLNKLDEAKVMFRKLFGENLAAAVQSAQAQKAEGSIVAEPFALGINEANVLCALGTTVAEILDDHDHAKRLYELAESAASTSPVPHTNLARWYLTHRPDGWEALAKYHLKHAANGGFRFNWWRHIQYRFQEAIREQVMPRNQGEGQDRESPTLGPTELQAMSSISRIRKTLITKGTLFLPPANVLLDILKRLIEMRYSLSQYRIKTLSVSSLAIRKLDVAVFDRQCVVIGVDWSHINSGSQKLIENHARSSRACTIVFDASFIGQMEASALSQSPIQDVQSSKVVQRISIANLQSLLNEEITVDRLLYHFACQTDS